MKNTGRIVFAGLSVVLAASLLAAVLTRDWANYREQLRALRTSSHAATTVDTRELDTAQQLVQLAVTHMERDYAQQALQLADHAVDMAFETALRDADDNPAPLTAETRELTARIRSDEATLNADQGHVADLQAKLPKAKPSEKDDIQQRIDETQAQVSLDQDELADAHEDLIRAGGDKRAIVQKQLNQHEASEMHGEKSMPPASPASQVEETTSSSILAGARALVSLRKKQGLLEQAKANAQSREAALAATHENLEKQMAEEKAQRHILRRGGATAAVAPASQMTAGGSSQTVVSGTGAGTPSTGSSAGAAASNAGSAPSNAGTGTAPNTEPAAGGSTSPRDARSMGFLRHLTAEQKDLSELDKRVEDEQALATIYGTWLTFVDVREKAFLHGIFVSIFWILAVALGVLVANYSVQRFFADLSPERRELHTMRTVALVVIQALGVGLILLVIFGVPNNFATFLALATAGVTVAMKDFIVGFVGWFVLMGRDGIRPGDWVEINGVGGEVLEVGLFRTVLLETGNWSDAAHPTGRKVAFVNSFAIEGHYFNFSTSGQWSWDELEIEVPSNLDPYPTADAIQKIAADETAPNARKAEEEWTRVVPTYAKRQFSGEPSMSVRPTAGGVTVTVRYITRVKDRQEVRGRMYRAIVELFHRSGSRQPVSVKAEATAATIQD